MWYDKGEAEPRTLNCERHQASLESEVVITHCSGCGTYLREGTRRCTGCSAPRENGTHPRIVVADGFECGECKKPVENEDKACGYCGNRLQTTHQLSELYWLCECGGMISSNEARFCRLCGAKAPAPRIDSKSYTERRAAGASD